MMGYLRNARGYRNMKWADIRKEFFMVWRITARAGVFVSALSIIFVCARCYVFGDCGAALTSTQNFNVGVLVLSVASLLYAKARENFGDNNIVGFLLLYIGTLALLIKSLAILAEFLL